MSRKKRITPTIEPERYELQSTAPVLFETGRRDFFKFLGAGIVVACVSSQATGFQEKAEQIAHEDRFLRRNF